MAFSRFSVPVIPAAFGRLCVETATEPMKFGTSEPAAFGRLCVETCKYQPAWRCFRPAAFGRLCVETVPTERSRLPPAQPPSGGCVLKLPYRRLG